MTTSVGSWPALSARVFGMTSSASAKAWMPARAGWSQCDAIEKDYPTRLKRTELLPADDLLHVLLQVRAAGHLERPGPRQHGLHDPR